MKILKSFKAFESNRTSDVPGHFIPLRSIGYYLDPEDGFTYAMLKAGGYEDEPYPAEEDLDEEGEAWEQLSDKERAAVNSVWKSCEDIVSPVIDWDLIDDIKDVALANEILDKGLYVKIEVKIKTNSHCYWTVYQEWYGHDKEDVYYSKYFNSKRRDIESTDRISDRLDYIITVYRSNHGGYLPVSEEQKKEAMEMVEQIKAMRPDLERRIRYGKW